MTDEKYLAALSEITDALGNMDLLGDDLDEVPRPVISELFESEKETLLEILKRHFRPKDD